MFGFGFRERVESALAALEAHRHEEAEKTLRALLAAHPRDDQLLYLLGIALIEQDREEEAIEVLKKAISLNRRDPAYHNALGVALRDAGRLAEGIESLERALRLDPGFADAHYNLALTHVRAREFAKGEQRWRALIAANPADTEAWKGLFDLQWLLGEHEAAVATLRAGIEANPASGDLRFALADALLALGRFEEGWYRYLWRINRHGFLKRLGLPFNDPDLMAPFPESLSGRTVRVHGEQGLGDDLFLLRFAAQLRERGARIEAAVLDRLLGMVSRSGVAEACIATKDRIPPSAEWKMLGDLPFLLRAHARPLPASLRFDPLPEKVREVEAMVAHLPRPLIGLTWRAGTAPKKGRIGQALYKEVAFEKFAQMARTFPGTLLILQREPKPQELKRLAELCGERLADFSALNADLEAMHALLARIDDYVGVSNTNMHLLAALGRGARVLVSRSPEFRWMAEGDESPWFPGFRVYRQAIGGDWTAALGTVAADICASHRVENRENPNSLNHRH